MTKKGGTVLRLVTLELKSSQFNYTSSGAIGFASLFQPCHCLFIILP